MNNKNTKEKNIHQQEDLFRGLVTLGLFDAHHVLPLFFKGEMPVTETELCRFHQLDVPLRLSWQNLDEQISGGFVHESGPHLLELDYKERKLSDGSNTTLMANISHAMIAQLFARTAILMPDRASARNIMDSYFGLEMNEILSIDETPKSHATRMKEAREGADFSRHHLSKVDFLGCLNSVLAARCPAPGRIPQNKIEGWAALAAGGFPMSKEVEKALESEKGKQAVKHFGKPLSIPLNENSSSTVVELINRIKRFTPQQLERFWREVVPASIGDLRSLYGDKNGRASMGLPTPDPEGARSYAEYVMLNRAQLREDRLKELVQNVHPAYAYQVFQYVSKEGLGRAVSILMENPSLFDAIGQYADPEKLDPFRPIQDFREEDRLPGQGFTVVKNPYRKPRAKKIAPKKK